MEQEKSETKDIIKRNPTDFYTILSYRSALVPTKMVSRTPQEILRLLLVLWIIIENGLFFHFRCCHGFVPRASRISHYIHHPQHPQQQQQQQQRQSSKQEPALSSSWMMRRILLRRPRTVIRSAAPSKIYATRNEDEEKDEEITAPPFSSVSSPPSLPPPRRRNVNSGNSHQSPHQLRLRQQGRRRHHSRSRSRSRRDQQQQQQQQQASNSQEWLKEATERLLATESGTLGQMGKWHEVASLFHAWSAFTKTDPMAPLQMERLLKRLLEEQQQQQLQQQQQQQQQERPNNNENHHQVVVVVNNMVDIDMYNAVLDAWACAALFKTQQQQSSASLSSSLLEHQQQQQQQQPPSPTLRAREILVLLQENYERNNNNNNNDDGSFVVKPNEQSFSVTLHAVSKTEGPWIARRLLAWMEYLYKSGKNMSARPTISDYILVLDAYANSRHTNAGVLAEGLIAHMKNVFRKDGDDDDINNGGGKDGKDDRDNASAAALFVVPATCYNIAIKAWTKAKRGGRESAEHAHRILEEMPPAQRDIVTYASVITAWANSGMKSHAVSRVEELLKEIVENQTSSPTLQQPNTIVLNAVMSAWVKSRNPTAVDRTAEILNQMEMAAAADDGPDGYCPITPDLISYNTHLHALSMHAKRPGNAERADALLRRMESMADGTTLNGKGVPVAVDWQPNLFAYNLVIEAHCRSTDTVGKHIAAMRAADTLRRLVKRDGVEPDTFSFNQVLIALARSSNMPQAAIMAEDLLVYMEDAYESGVHPAAKPDAIGYSSVIVAHSRSGQVGAAERAEALLRRLQQRNQQAANDNINNNSNSLIIKPNRILYNSLIDCWAKSGGTRGARKAEALLEEMQALYEASNRTDESIKPNLVSYNGVLNAWARSNTRCCANKAETYLQQMWELYRAGDTKVQPDDFSYNTVINAISKSKHSHKAQKALRLLRKMDLNYQAGKNKQARPNEFTYTAVLNSCAFPAALDSRTRRKALDTAIFTLQELQESRYASPNQVTYGTFLKACNNLLPDDDVMRGEVMKKAFQQCCRDGLLGDMVWNYFRKAAPRALYHELLSSAAGRSTTGRLGISRISSRDLPEEWRKNVEAKNSWRRNPNSNQHNRRRDLDPKD